jgi:hypothetical protein
MILPVRNAKIGAESSECPNFLEPAHLHYLHDNIAHNNGLVQMETLASFICPITQKQNSRQIFRILGSPLILELGPHGVVVFIFRVSMISRNRSNSRIDGVGVSSPFLALRLMRPGTAFCGFVALFSRGSLRGTGSVSKISWDHCICYLVNLMIRRLSQMKR